MISLVHNFVQRIIHSADYGKSMKFRYWTRERPVYAKHNISILQHNRDTEGN